MADEARGHEVAVLGGGSWGTALAIHLGREESRVRLWVHDGDLAGRMETHRENAKYLAGFRLPSSIHVTSSLEEALRGVADVLLVVPSQYLRSTLADAAPHIKAGARLCSASKGIETDSLMRMSQVIEEVAGPTAVPDIAVLSGPSFAREVAAGQPTAVVIASASQKTALHLQSLLSRGSLRAYTNQDVVGVEIGGAVKNVIAIGAGALWGLGLGSNALAALITRGLSEISRLAASLGGRPETLSGLAGLGDLVLTCTGGLSRNRGLGEALGKGRSLAEYQSGTSMVVEGVRTTMAVCRLAGRQGVEMPIAGQIHALLHEGRPVAEAVADLLSRPPRPE